jgi:hypothetical protein
MKLFELLVDDLAEILGFSGNSLVSAPAHEEEFYAFNQEDVEELIVTEVIKQELLKQINFVEKLPGETKDAYVSRCIPALQGEGYDNDQAAAICYETFGFDLTGLPGYENEPSGSTIDTPSSFSFASEDQQIVIGPLLVPGKKIIRVDERTGEPYEVFFSENTVKIIAEGMMRDKLLDRLNLEHDPSQTIEGYMMSSWIVVDPKMDTSRAYGFKEMPKGTWFGMYRVVSPDVWKKVKAKEVTGFSIEAWLSQKLISNQ